MINKTILDDESMIGQDMSNHTNKKFFNMYPLTSRYDTYTDKKGSHSSTNFKNTYHIKFISFLFWLLILGVYMEHVEAAPISENHYGIYLSFDSDYYVTGDVITVQILGNTAYTEDIYREDIYSDNMSVGVSDDSTGSNGISSDQYAVNSYVGDNQGLSLEVTFDNNPEYYFRYLGDIKESMQFIADEGGEYTFTLYDDAGAIVYARSVTVHDISSEDCIHTLLGERFTISVLGSERLELLFYPYLTGEYLSNSSTKFLYSEELSDEIQYSPAMPGKYYLYLDGIFVQCYIVSGSTRNIFDTEDGVMPDTLSDGIVKDDVSLGKLTTSSTLQEVSNISESNISILSEGMMRDAPDSSVDKDITRDELMNRYYKYYMYDSSFKESTKDLLSVRNSKDQELDYRVYSSVSYAFRVDTGNNFGDDYESGYIAEVSSQEAMLTESDSDSMPEVYGITGDTPYHQKFDVDVLLINHSIIKMGFLGLVNSTSLESLKIGVDELELKEILDIEGSVHTVDKQNYFIEGKRNVKAYAVNPYDLNFSEAYFTSIAVGRELWKCRDWDFDSGTCLGSWEKLMDLIPGTEYVVELSAADPGFIETFDTSVALDLSLLALNNDTLILAWIKNGTTVTGVFEVWNTNGSLIVDETVFDSSMGAVSRISLAPINTDNFIIGAMDSSATTASFYIYNRTGSLLQASTTVSSAVGTLNDVSVCQLGDRFIYSFMDDSADDASFQIWNNTGNSIGTITDVDTGATPEAALQNLVSCANINGTHWVYFYFDDSSNDATINIRTNTGTSVTLTDINSNVGETSQLAVATAPGNYIASLYYNSVVTVQDVVLNIRRFSGGVLSNLATATPDTDAGVNSRLDISEIRGGATSYFVATWFDGGDTTIKAAVYDVTGGQVTAPFIVTSTPNSAYPVVAVAGHDSNLGSGLCNGTFVIAYTNSSGVAVFNKYNLNGSQWDGTCPDVTPPTVTLNAPSSGQIIYSSNISLNFTASDDRNAVLPNCTLWINATGLFSRNITLYNVSSGVLTSINLTDISDSEYLWNVECYDNSSNGAFAPLNYSILINMNPPSILDAALNESLLNQSEYIRINVTIYDEWSVDVAYVTIFYPDSNSYNYTMAASGSEYYLDFNDTLLIGTYRITMILANDTLGQASYVEYSSLEFDVAPSPPSTFNLLSPENMTVSSNLLPTMSWQQTYEQTFANYTLLIDKDPDFIIPEYSYSTFNIENNYYTLSFALDTNSVYYWRVIAYDIFGSSTNSSGDFTYITDTLGPVVTLNFPENQAFVLSSTIIFNYTPSDANYLDSCALYTNISGSWNFTQLNSTPINNEDNYFIVDGVSDGSYVWNVYCNDSLDNSRFSTNNYTFYVDTIGPEITLSAPENDAVENTTNNVKFYFSAMDVMTDIYSCSLIINNIIEYTSYVVIEDSMFNFTDFLLNGNYSWGVNCTDTNGVTSASERRNISVSVIDTNRPLITLNYPGINDYVQQNTVIFNYTPEDATGITNCSIYIDGVYTQTNSTPVQNFVNNYFTVTSLIDEKHNWSVTCYDNSTGFNQGFSEVRTFYVDTINPEIELHNPGNLTVNTSTVQFTYTPTDTYLSTCSLYGNFSGTFGEDQTNISPQSGVENVFNKILSDGWYIWNVACLDLSGRVSFSEHNYSVKVDTRAPEYSNINVYPANSSTYTPVQIYLFNITWNDNFNISSVIIEENFSGISRNTTLNSTTDIYSFTTGNLSAGIYYYSWYAVDEAGNINITPIYYYNVNKAISDVSVIIGGSSDNVTIVEDEYLMLSATMSTPSFGDIYLYIDGIQINSGSSPISNNTLFSEPGVFNITAYYPGNENHTSSQETHFVTVNDVTPASITLLNPLNYSPVASGDIALQYVVDDSSNISNCSLFIDGAMNQTNYSVSTGVTQYFIVHLEQNNYTWSIGCYDAFNNYNSSPTWIFRALDATLINMEVMTSESEYEIGETLRAYINTTGQFDNPLNAEEKSYIVLGNTTLPWWNTSYVFRMPLLMTNLFNSSREDTIEINITGLSGINDCFTQIVIIENKTYNSTKNQSILPFTILGGDNVSYCLARFNVNATALSVNSSGYWVYFGNGTYDSMQQDVPLKGLRVQRNTIYSTGTTISVNVDSVKNNKSFILFTANTASSNPNLNQFTSDMLTDTQIRFERYLGTTASNISWQLIEGSDINVQRGLTSFSATNASLNVTINPVNTSKAFLIMNGRVNSGTASISPRGIFMGRIINSTQITLERGISGTAATAGWQVVEWDDAQVQSGNVTFTTGTTSLVSINPVNTSRSFVIISRTAATDTGADTSYVMAYLVNSTTLNISRVSTSSSTRVSWQVIELPAEFYVDSGISSTTSTLNQQISPVIMNRSFHTESWSTNQGGTTYANALMISRMTNETNILFAKQVATNTNTIAWSSIYSRPVTVSQLPKEELIYWEYNVTGPLGYYYFDMSTYNRTFGNYSLVTESSKLDYIPAYDNYMFEIIPDKTPPNVTLSYPLNGTIGGSGSYSFSYIPYDLNLAECELYIDVGGVFGPQVLDDNPINNITNTFTDFTVGVRIYSWNVGCYDSYGNLGFAPANFTLNISGPDIYPVSMWYWNASLIEDEIVQVSVNLSNIGLSPALNPFQVRFFRNHPELGGIEIANITVTDMDVGENITLNISYQLLAGSNNLFAYADADDAVNESSEDNNIINISLDTGQYHYYYGNVSMSIVLGIGSSEGVLFNLGNYTTTGYVFVSDSDSSFSFSNLQSISRNINGDPVNDDFSNIDTALGIVDSPDSVNAIWTNNTNEALHLIDINLTSGSIQNVPIVNSTDSGQFITGLLWDVSDDTSLNLQYDSSDREDIVLVTPIDSYKIGKYGTYNYEVRIPASLKDYKGSGSSVSFYYEII